MSRNSSGTYSLPSGNPVVTGTTITSTWANTTLSDIATALTDSLSRSGLGSMTAGLGLFDGTASLPGLSWGTELTSGLYRAGAADYRWVNTTTELLQLTTNLFRVSGTAPVFRINESDAAANNKLWDVIVSAEQMAFRVLTDALAATNWLTIDRTAGVVDTIALAATALTVAATSTFSTSFVANTSVAIDLASARPHVRWTETDGAANNQRWLMGPQGEQFIAAAATDTEGTITNWLAVDRTSTTIDTVNFPNGVLQYGGTEVGYRNATRSDFSGNVSATNAMRGTLRRYTGSGGHSFDIASGVVESGGIITLINDGSGTFTVTVSGGATLQWYNGSGTISSGTRTIAVGGAITVYMNSTSNPLVWGTGIS